MLLAWTHGRYDLTDLVALFRPQGASLLAQSNVQSSLALFQSSHASGLPGALSAIDLVGDLPAPESAGVLRPLLADDDPRLRFHSAVALSRAGIAEADAAIFNDFDNVAAERLPSLVRVMGRIREPSARQRLDADLRRREDSADVPVRVAARAVRFEWDPDPGIFRLEDSLAAASRQERDLAERYLSASKTQTTTELLRRALAREKRDAVRDQLRRILDSRNDNEP
jgi:hypothetical protein